MIDFIRNKLAIYQRRYDLQDGGCFYVYDGRVSGWSDSYRPASQWQPGVFVITPDDNAFVAVGGTDADGAEAWQPCTLESVNLALA